MSGPWSIGYWYHLHIRFRQLVWTNLSDLCKYNEMWWTTYILILEMEFAHQLRRKVLQWSDFNQLFTTQLHLGPAYKLKEFN